MHIAFATIEFVTERVADGGLANYLAKASRIFADHGHKVTIIVLSEGNDTFEYCPNVTVVRVLRDESELAVPLSLVKNMEIKRNIAYCWHSYLIRRTIKKIDRKSKVDIVQYCDLNALGLFRIKKIPSVVRMSSFSPIDRETHKSVFDLKNARIELSDRISFAALNRADAVFAPSALTAVVLKKFIKKEVSVLETPTMAVDFNRLSCLPDILNGKKYLLFFGTLNNKKGLKVIVQSVYEILKRNTCHYFVLIGKDCGVSMCEGMRTPVIKKIKEEAGEYQDRIIYFPSIADRDLLNTIIYHAEVCILPFRFENLPNTCVEALELGRIVISTFKSGVSQLIKDKYNGFLVEQDNPKALVDKIQEVLALPEKEKKRISDHAVKRTKKMNPENFYKYMIEYYQRIIDYR